MITFKSTEDLKNQAITRLKIKIGDEDIDETVLSTNVEDVINEIEAIRNYPPDYTEEMIVADLKRYFNNIVDVAMYDYNQIGIEGETTHSENGVSRSYRSRNSFFRGVCPISRIV